MRRIPKPIPSDGRLGRFRVLGAIVPEFDDLVAIEQIFLPSPASPILPLRLRSALLAGVAMVIRGGPAMLEMLQAHTVGENRTRFAHLAGHNDHKEPQIPTASAVALNLRMSAPRCS